ncbi:MAG: DUF1499 domain-containing protein [Pseudomonadota bacterium]|nr:DUF1499 domain-containing protein [Pseudomonadota bacterium]
MSIKKLPRCSSSPNCVCSEYPDDEEHYAKPLRVSGFIRNDEVMKKLITAITETGGVIVEQKGHLLTATYTSKLLRFVDDVQARYDMENRQVHIRSASRVGYYDFKANKARVEAIRKAFSKQAVKP